MLKTINRALLASTVLTLMGVAACKKDARTSWDTEVLVPIATSTLNLQNITKDSSVTARPDGSLVLAFNSTLYEFNLADQLINIPDTAIGQKFNLANLALPNQGFRYKVSLGFLAENMTKSPDPGQQFLGNFILGQNGNTIAVPPVNNLSPGAYTFDATAYFDSAVLATGVAQIWTVNQLPVPVQNINCELYNTGEATPLATQYVAYIPPFDSVYVEIPLAGKKIKNKLDFKVTSMSTPGSNGVPVPIDTTDFIELRMFVTALTTSEAWAKFPSQNVVERVEEVTVEIGERKFSYIDARKGRLHVFVTSSVQENLYLEYTLEGAFNKFGQPVKEFTYVPAALPGSTTTVDKYIDISGVAINLTGKDGSKFNTYTQKIIARIDSSGQTRHITSADTINIRYEIEDVAPNYIKGYAGRDTVLANDTALFDFISIFKSGSIDLEEVNMNFTVENGIGVDGEITINGLTALSDNNGSKNLNGSVVGQKFTVNRATDFPLTPAINQFAVNNSNSNIRELLGILPNKLIYDVGVRTNINGNNYQYRDFAYLESNLKVGLNAEIPLSFIANNLVLVDTIDFNISGANTNVAGITDGVINLIAQNSYPIEANASLVIVDSNWVPVDTLIFDQTIKPSDLDNATCKSLGTKRSLIPLYVTQQRMENLKKGRHAMIVAAFNTKSGNNVCNGQYLRIYSEYKLDITLSAKFNYKVNASF